MSESIQLALLNSLNDILLLLFSDTVLRVMIHFLSPPHNFGCIAVSAEARAMLARAMRMCRWVYSQWHIVTVRLVNQKMQ